MDRRIRQIAALITVLLIAVTISAGWVQGIRAEQIASYEPADPHHPGERARNIFRIYEECRWERGPILSIDGQVLAESRLAAPGHRCKYDRNYPAGDLAPHVVGQWSLYFGKTGLESAYNADLVGQPPPAKTLAEVFQERPRVGDTLVSTIDTRLQKAAVQALAGRRGGIVALNPKTGAVLVAASVPSYDPNGLASNDRITALQARCSLGLGFRLDDQGNTVRNSRGEPVLCSNPNSPLLSVALQAQRPPGSSFKVVTAAAALESGKYTPGYPYVPSRGAYTPPGDVIAIHNFGGGVCGGNITEDLRVSCNTAFAQIANDIGAGPFLATAQAMGFDSVSGSGFVGCDGGPVSDIDLTHVGCLPSEFDRRDAKGNVVARETLTTPGYRSRAGFGQWVIQASPFGMALVAATVGNGGFVPRPRFAERVINREGQTVREIRTGIGPAAISPKTAGELAQMMRGVVTGGTAASAFSGFPIPVAGKTGTAQQPTCSSDEAAIFGPGCGRLPHAWFIAFAPVQDPTIAIAVLIERGGGNNEEATGGHVAAPVAVQVLQKYFELYPVPRGGQ